jgi:hypothetical protein
VLLALMPKQLIELSCFHDPDRWWFWNWTCL